MVTLAVGDAGAVAPVHRYTSYDVAPEEDGHVSVAVVGVPMVLPSVGDVLVTHDGTDEVPVGYNCVLGTVVFTVEGLDQRKEKIPVI